MPEENLIPITAPESDFKHFLNINNNKRVFFSGKYGIGKTYFLKEFFSIHKGDYEVFHLFPINYQISPNQDIIELLKYDILIELTKKDPQIFKENEVKGIKDSSLLFYSWVKNNCSVNGFLNSAINFGEGLADLSGNPVISLFSKLGRPLTDLLAMDKEYQEFKKEYKLGEKAVVEKFTKAMSAKSISETDYFSHLLTEKIKQLKGTKKSVLVLDDMDRVDPEHLFRILNLFSAHFNDEKNKFGFDTVIIVGHIENIKSVFHHKYGAGADFEGYFDKFFTVKPYFINNKKIILERIPDLVKEIKHEDPQLNTAFGPSGYIQMMLGDVLMRAVVLDQLTIRQLYKPLNYSFDELKKGVYVPDPFSNQFQQILDISIKMLIAIFGGQRDHFISILKSIKENISESDDGRNARYAVYSSSMLKSLVSPEIAKSQSILKGPYKIDNHLSAEITVDGGTPADQVKLFYDLLIEYVSKSKHIKASLQDYDKN